MCPRAASAPADTAYGLAQDFLKIVHKREGERLAAWIEAAQASDIPELHHFVKGILKDKDAVVAGLTLAYSTGPEEAKVQRRETCSSVLCLVAPSFLSYGNVCSMLPNKQRKSYGTAACDGIAKRESQTCVS